MVQASVSAQGMGSWRQVPPRHESTVQLSASTQSAFDPHERMRIVAAGPRALVTSEEVYPEGGDTPLITFEVVSSPKQGNRLTDVVAPAGMLRALNLIFVTFRPAVVAHARRAGPAPQLNCGMAV